MKSIVEGFRAIYRNDRRVIVMMGVLMLVSIGLIIFSISSLKPGSVVVKVGYSDISAYRDGKWYYMWVFAGLGAILGVVHNLIAVKIYEKKGGSAAMLFLTVSVALVIFTIIYLTKLLGEG